MVEIIISENKLALDKLNKLKFGKFKVIGSSKINKAGSLTDWRGEKILLCYKGDIKVVLESSFITLTYLFRKEKQGYTLYVDKVEKNTLLLAKSFEKIFGCKVKIVLGKNHSLDVEKDNANIFFEKILIGFIIFIIGIFLLVIFVGKGVC